MMDDAPQAKKGKGESPRAGLLSFFCRQGPGGVMSSLSSVMRLCSFHEAGLDLPKSE